MSPATPISPSRDAYFRARFAQQKAWWDAFEAAAQEEVDGVAAYGCLAFRNALNATLRQAKAEMGLPLRDAAFVVPWLRDEAVRS